PPVWAHIAEQYAPGRHRFRCGDGHATNRTTQHQCRLGGLAFSVRSCFSSLVGKGDETKLAVLGEAGEGVRRAGLSGLTIGSLAERAQLSKSGLFGHFRSKEALQLQVLEHARSRFEDAVVRPALRAPRGESRVRELFDRWLAWDELPGGCPFIAAAAEF